MITNITYEQFNAQNEYNRMALDRMQCIKVKKVVPGNAFGGAFVEYDDCRYRCRDTASIQDVVDYVSWGEIYVDTGKVLLEPYFQYKG